MLKTKYEEIVHLSDIASGKFRHPSEVIAMALQEKIEPVKQDDGKGHVILIGIDWQNDFVLPAQDQVAPGEPYGSLSVPGAKQDIANWTRFIYDNYAKISRIMLSVDTHRPKQIFHRSAWRDWSNGGSYVEPYTLITAEKIRDHTYDFTGGEPKRAAECAQTLAEAGKGGIFIWPEHCIEGTLGWNPETELMQMVIFYSVVRDSKPIYLYKGRKLYSEMYGILEPEYNPRKKVNWNILSLIVEHGDDWCWYRQEGKFKRPTGNKIIIAGEAASHCVLESVRQILKYLDKGGMPEAAQNLYILEDCTSPVAGFEQQMQDAFDDFKRQGVNIVKSTDLEL